MTSGERSGVQLATVFNGCWTKVAAASAMYTVGGRFVEFIQYSNCAIATIDILET